MRVRWRTVDADLITAGVIRARNQIHSRVWIPKSGASGLGGADSENRERSHGVHLHAMSQVAAFGSEQGSVGGDIDLLCAGSDLESDVDSQRLRHEHGDALTDILPEAGQFSRQFVHACGQECERVIARLGACGFVAKRGLSICGNDAHARNDRRTDIRYRAGYGTGGLREGARNGQEDDSDGEAKVRCHSGFLQVLKGASGQHRSTEVLKVQVFAHAGGVPGN